MFNTYPALFFPRKYQVYHFKKTDVYVTNKQCEKITTELPTFAIVFKS